MKTIISTLTIFSLLSLPIKGQLSTSPAKDNSLLVKGTAILKQTPEIIYASVNVKSESDNYSSCQKKLLTKLDKVRSSILKQEISRDLIKTNDMTITERQEYINGKTTKTGYNGSISLIIESPYSPEFANKLLTAFTADSLVLNYSIGFKLSEKQKSFLRQQAITNAIENAKERSLLIAKSSNVKLIKLNSIVFLDEETSFIRDNDITREQIIPAQNVFYSIRGNSEATPSIDFNPKEIGIIKSVRMEWIIEDNPSQN